jgi:hypothetical protein
VPPGPFGLSEDRESYVALPHEKLWKPLNIVLSPVSGWLIADLHICKTLAIIGQFAFVSISCFGSFVAARLTDGSCWFLVGSTHGLNEKLKERQLPFSFPSPLKSGTAA